MALTYAFSARVWLYSGQSAWHFITLPIEYAQEIKQVTHADLAVGFGSLKVIAKSGGLQWSTSIFPDTSSGSYLLPIKKDIRAKLHLEATDLMKISLTLVDY